MTAHPGALAVLLALAALVTLTGCFGGGSRPDRPDQLEGAALTAEIDRLSDEIAALPHVTSVGLQYTDNVTNGQTFGGRAAVRRHRTLPGRPAGRRGRCTRGTCVCDADCMAFALRALIAAHDLAAAAAQSLGVGCCPLTEDLSLVPLLTPGEDPGRAESSDGDAIFRLTPAEEHLAADGSLHGAVAYVEAETFAGVGVQAAAVWRDGVMTLGPLVWDSTAAAPGTPEPTALPVNTALAAIGVIPSAPKDAFDTVGLGRHRFTADWLTPAPGNT